MPGPRIDCVGAIITDATGRLLLIKRGHEPEAGRWSLPGGRVEPGESDHQALAREVREETGLTVTPGRLAGTVERPWPDGRGGGVGASRARVLVIRDYEAVVTGGELAAGDDADDARWVSPSDFGALPLTTGLQEVLDAWGVLDRAHGAGAPHMSRPGRMRLPQQSPVPSPALVAEATRRAGVVWLTVPGRDRPFPVWHIWRTVGEPGALNPPPPGGAYLVTGPGEQPAPGLEEAGQVTVTVPSKQAGGALVAWTAGVRRVNPGSAEWAAVIGPLVAGRLNAALGQGEVSPAQRWADTGTVFCLTPVS
jgi:ADP-ribose pyrophosphatase YjhB (NUDIX family)